MNRFWKFISKWGFPLVIGGVYWLFDTTVDYVSHTVVAPSFGEALFPVLFSVEGLFRIMMTLFSVIGAKFFEVTMERVDKLEKQLFLNEFAVENTKAFAMLWTDETGKIIKVNQHAAQRLGYTKAELMAKSLFDITVGHTQEVWNLLLSKLKKQGNITYYARQRRKDGTEIDAAMFLQYLKVKSDQYQFAFVCDAFHCPADDLSTPAPCGRAVTPTLVQLLAE